MRQYISNLGRSLGTAALALLGINGCGDQPETYIGFDHFFNQGYSVASFDIPTRGDIVEITMPETATQTARGDTLFISGLIPYRINPERRFTPRLDHTDMEGNTLEDGSPEDPYWRDERYGTIVLVRGSPEDSTQNK
jgi:hypothetical protein